MDPSEDYPTHFFEIGSDSDSPSFKEEEVCTELAVHQHDPLQVECVAEPVSTDVLLARVRVSAGMCSMATTDGACCLCLCLCPVARASVSVGHRCCCLRHHGHGHHGQGSKKTLVGVPRSCRPIVSSAQAPRWGLSGFRLGRLPILGLPRCLDLSFPSLELELLLLHCCPLGVRRHVIEMCLPETKQVSRGGGLRGGPSLCSGLSRTG